MKPFDCVRVSPTMEQIAVFQEKISLAPIDLRADITSFEEILLEKLKKQLEGRCSKHGFVIPGSLQLLSRSMGFAEKGRATADFLYYLKAQGKVYNPPDGLVVEGQIQLKNKMGCYVVLDNAIRIMIPRDLHIGNDEFDTLEVGNRIRIEIKRSQFRANATHILSIGQYLGKAEGSGAAAAAKAPVVAAAAATLGAKATLGAEENDEELDEEEEDGSATDGAAEGPTMAAAAEEEGEGDSDDEEEGEE
jgi:DNA-directed RNA polymerase subunit E'/Rpb7